MAIYTTITIESLNGVMRKAARKRRVLPTSDTSRKVIYLATQGVSKK